MMGYDNQKLKQSIKEVFLAFDVAALKELTMKALQRGIQGKEVIDKSWKDSFSARKKKTASENTDEIVEDAIKDDAHHGRVEDYVRILCQCGNIVEIPANYKEDTIYPCPKCSHQITVPQKEE